ncbi:MAG: TlpA disulfide reductase family protein [Pseudomonadota bacterium]
MKRALFVVLTAALLAVHGLAAAGETAPDFTLIGLDGTSVSLSSLKGKVVVLNFFRTFCPYCVQEVPELNDIAGRLGSKGVAVLGMGLDSANALKGFVRTNKVAYPVAVVSPDVQRAYSDVRGTGGLRGVPTTVVVSPTGEVSRVFPGRPAASVLRRTVEALLPSK